MTVLERVITNKNIINFLNWFSQYNLIPKGMALKLLLLSNEAIENIELKEFNSIGMVFVGV